MRSEPASDPRQLWIVFFVAMTVIGLETVTFQALSFLADYHQATEVLSVALLGISLGGVLAWVWRDGGLGWILAAFPLTVLGTMPVLLRASDQPTLMMAVLTAPYAVASLVISRMFARLPPSRVYLYDLVGAGLSAVVVVAAVPLLREEGSFVLLGLLGTAPLVIYARSEGSRGLLATGGALAAVCAALLVAHLTVDPFNLLKLARGGEAQKLFNRWTDAEGKDRYSLLYSRGSLIERIDIVSEAGKEKRGPWQSVYNGRVVDSITSDRAEIGRLDNRMPTLLKAGQDPSTLLVGPSGQGLCKAVQALGNGPIDAVEINGAIGGLMAGPFYERSGRAYEKMDLTIGDVRTFLARSEKDYDYITLLNTHRIWSMGHQGPPEYVHTIEAMRDYFEHLTPEGYVLFEERNINERAELGIRRLLHTAMAALRERGVADPTRHVAVWELYHGCKEARHFKDPAHPGDSCDRAKLFTFLMLKSTPITEAEETHLLEWGKMLADRGPDKSGNHRGIVWRYLPSHPTTHRWTDVVRAGSLEELPDVDPAKHRVSVVTDDVPFPYDVFRERPELDEMLARVTKLAVGMVLLPAALAFFGTRKDSGLGGAQRAAATTVLTAFFGLLGLAYLLVEVVLIQKLGIFLSSPVYSVVVVLGTMLVASGLGGHASAGWSRAAVLGATVGVACFTGLALGVDGVVDALMVLPFALRVVAAIVLVGPVAFVMGAPFPHAMAFTKEALGEAHAGLMFAVNGALSAIAAPLALVLAMDHGYDRTLLAGGALYLGCAALLGLVTALAPRASGAGAP